MQPEESMQTETQREDRTDSLPHAAEIVVTHIEGLVSSQTDAQPQFGDASVRMDRNGEAGAVLTRRQIPVHLDEAQLESVVRTVAGGADNVQDICPLSPLQEGMLFHRLLNETSDTYVLSTLFELESPTIARNFVDAVQEVVDRHDILRSAVLWEGLPRPVHVVYRRAKLSAHEEIGRAHV